MPGDFTVSNPAFPSSPQKDRVKRKKVAQQEAPKWQTLLPGQEPMEAGDCILFNWKTIHCATKNWKRKFRLSMDTRIFFNSSSLLWKQPQLNADMYQLPEKAVTSPIKRRRLNIE